MTSKEFKQTAKTVSRNFERYTEAMETDIQILISSMLNVIESKIISLRKLLKLKLCIKHVRSRAGFNYFNNMAESTTFTNDDNSLKPRETGSLEELSSIIYEVDKSSLPSSESKHNENVQDRLRHLEDYVDIESLCSALNHHHRKLSVARDLTEENRDALNKYIYLLLDAEREKEAYKKCRKSPGKFQNAKIGDCFSDSKKDLPKDQDDDSKIFIGKQEYDSIVNILNMVLRSYKMQEEIISRNHGIEKRKTDPSINKPLIEERKIVSESLCQPKDNGLTEKKTRTKKSANCLNS